MIFFSNGTLADIYLNSDHKDIFFYQFPLIEMDIIPNKQSFQIQARHKCFSQLSVRYST